MLFEIRRAHNGCLLKVIDVDDGSGEHEAIVYQETYDDDIECFADCLRYVEEVYGPSTNRYSQKRIYIHVDSGDKYEPPSEGA